MGLSLTIATGPRQRIHSRVRVLSKSGFPLVVSYDSQGYGGGIRPHLHTRFSRINYVFPSYNFEITISNSSCIIARLFVVTDKCFDEPLCSNGPPGCQASCHAIYIIFHLHRFITNDSHTILHYTVRVYPMDLETRR
jgi:hypothetical protein